MIGIGNAIGAGIGLLSSLIGGNQAAKAAARAKRNNERMMRENQNWYDRRWNEDPTQTATAQRLLTKTMDTLRRRDKAAAGAAAVGGATEESVAAAKEASAKAIGDVASQIAANGEARKDAVEQQYMASKQALMNQQSAIEQQRAQNIAQATQAAGTAAMKAGIAVDGMTGGSDSKSANQPIGTGNAPVVNYNDNGDGIPRDEFGNPLV